METTSQKLRASLPLATLGLLLFVAGTHHCLIGAWKPDAGMACMSLPAAIGSASTSAPAGHCAGAAEGDEARLPGACGCCIGPAVTPGTTAALAVPVEVATLVPLFAAAAPPAPAPAPAASPRTEARPPTRLPRAPLAARPPPLL